jgi:hypothetical protein
MCRALSWWRIHLPGQSSNLFLQIPVTLLALPNNTVDWPFVLVQWIDGELSPNDRRNTNMVFNCEHISLFLQPPIPFKNTRFLHSVFTMSHNVNRTDVLTLLPVFTQNFMFIRGSRFWSLIFPPTVCHRLVLLPLLLGNERLSWSVAHANASWNMSRRAWG